MSELTKQLKRHEGLRLNPYRCTAGKLTIGYGRNLEDVGISEEEAEFMLMNDVVKVRLSLTNRIEFFSDLDKCRRDCLTNMAFNIGVSGLLKFKKMLAALERGHYNEAASQMLDSKWARQVGYRANELSEQMRTGRY